MILKVLNVTLCLFIVVVQIGFWKMSGDDACVTDALEHLGSLRHGSPILEQIAVAYGYMMQFFFLALPRLWHLVHLPQAGPMSRGNIESLRAFLQCNLSPLDQHNETACSVDIDREGVDTMFKYMAHFDMLAAALALLVINFNWSGVLHRFKAVVGEPV